MPEGSPTTLGGAARYFWSQPTPKVISAYLLTAASVRLAIGSWRTYELVIPLLVLLLEPFTEWVIHVVVLHWRPRRIAGRTVDLYAARTHRAHHLDPRELSILFVPMRLLVLQAPAIVLLVILIAPSLGIALSTIAAASAMLLTYEWIHFLIHTPYIPRRRWYRARWRAHRLHHFRNERFWFGVTTNFGDRILNTYPAKADVAPSATVRTLGVDVSA